MVALEGFHDVVRFVGDNMPWRNLLISQHGAEKT